MINYFMAEIFLYYTGYFPMTFQHKIEMSNYNTRWGMVIAIIALGIKASKNWHLQQQQNLALLRKRTRAEMQLQKARIHPELMLRSLDTIYSSLQSRSVNASSQIMDLSDLLSYSLYESEAEWVPLKKEVQEWQHLISLEQANKKRVIDLQMQTEGSIDDMYIAPMVIVKLLEECMTVLHTDESISHLVRLQMIVENSCLELNLVITDLYDAADFHIKWMEVVGKTKNLLSEYYSQEDFQIKISEENYKTWIRLKLKLVNNPKKVMLVES
jgi:LytS/YehU family sensor histidine kinase